jgi:hypothetical protein
MKFKAHTARTKMLLITTDTPDLLSSFLNPLMLFPDGRQ